MVVSRNPTSIRVMRIRLFAAVKLGYMHVFHSQGLGAPIGLDLGFVDVTISKSTSCGGIQVLEIANYMQPKNYRRNNAC